jgi:hypothetical protein
MGPWFRHHLSSDYYSFHNCRITVYKGEGFLRLALAENEVRLRQAVRQMKKAMKNMKV